MKLGVLLLNLGGPSNLKEDRPFLFNLFSDPDIIPVPFSRWLQKPIAYLIAISRKRLSSGYYQAIGGGSPLARITSEQAGHLEQKLKNYFKDVRVYVAMRYWRPSTREAWQRIRDDRRTHLVVLPLYPHYSIATIGSSMKALDSVMRDEPLAMSQERIEAWYHHPLYIEAVADHIEKAVCKLPSRYRNDFDLIFSAHSLPMKIIRAGDPYEKQIHETIRLVLERLHSKPDWPKPDWHLSYQSKTGLIRWLEPSTSDLLKQLAGRHRRALLMVPISFVSDHVETLYEIDILYRSEAQQLGFPHFSRVDSLNVAPKFMDALADLVRGRCGVR